MGRENKGGRQDPVSWRERLQRQARELQIQIHALWLAFRDPRTPWYAKAWLALVLGYAVSPIDLIPDFIPLVGYLDDLILVPAGIALAVRMIPPAVLTEARTRARETVEPGGRIAWLGAFLVSAFWLLVLAGIFFLIESIVKRK